MYCSKKKDKCQTMWCSLNIATIGVKGGNSQLVSNGLIFGCRECIAMGTPVPHAQMRRFPTEWDTANLWLFNVVPLADMLLSVQAVACIFQQPNTDIEKGA